MCSIASAARYQTSTQQTDKIVMGVSCDSRLAPLFGVLPEVLTQGPAGSHERHNAREACLIGRIEPAWRYMQFCGRLDVVKNSVSELQVSWKENTVSESICNYIMPSDYVALTTDGKQVRCL